MNKLHAELLFILLTLSITAFSQEFTTDGYYQFPINPGVQNYLAGTVGEIRATHFHTGIDIKTGRKIGLPVYATADGFISRINIKHNGYGHVLYMQHPNGTFSVYAHLDQFQEKIRRYVRKKQYQEEDYFIEMYPAKDQFPFKKGELIAYSGNTGSSIGPHLHFEIRDANNQPLDVLKFGFTEIKDRIAPIVKKIAFTSLEEKARINHFFGRYEFDLIKVDNTYRTRVPITLKGKIGVEIYSYDPMDGVSNKNGIIETIMVIDNDTAFHEFKKKLNFSKQRSILMHYNYAASKKGSKRFNKLYLDKGNESDIYKKVNKGIHFTSQQKILVFTRDSHNNLSATEVKINNDKVLKSLSPKLNPYEVIGNFLHLKSDAGVGLLLDQWSPVKPYHSDRTYNYFVWDLRKGLPDSIFVNGSAINTHFIRSLPPNQKISHYQHEFDMNLKHRSLFDTLHLGFSKKVNSLTNNEYFEFKNVTNPIRSNIEIKLKPAKRYDIEKSHVYGVRNKKPGYIGGNWSGNSITFKTRDLVTYTIMTDTIPPKVTPYTTSASKFAFIITDELSGIKSFRAELDGKFVLMRYEPKKKLIWTEKPDANIPFKGEFKLEVKDNANNKTIYTRTL